MLKPSSIIKTNKPLLTRRNLGIFLLVGSLFIFPFYARDNVSTLFGAFNVVYYIGWALLVAESKLYSEGKTKYLVAILIAHFLTMELLNSAGLFDSIRYFLYNYLPLFVVICHISSRGTEYSRELGASLLNTFNFFTISLFVILVLDLLTGSRVTYWLIRAFEPAILGWINVGLATRHVSIIGHYLITSSVYLAFFLLNVAYYKLNKGKGLIDLWVVYLVSTVGILSTASKTPLVLLLVSMVLTSTIGKNKGRLAAIMIVVLLVAYEIGFFDYIIERFGEQDITSGRNEALLNVWEFEGAPHLLYGYGSTLQKAIAPLVSRYDVSTMQEYPYIAVAYKYGTIHAVLLLFVQFFVPVSLAIKEGRTDVAFLPIILAADFGTFNGYLAIPDACMISSLFVLILSLLLSRDNEEIALAAPQKTGAKS